MIRIGESTGMRGDFDGFADRVFDSACKDGYLSADVLCDGRRTITLGVHLLL
jgi:hypothetical protein